MKGNGREEKAMGRIEEKEGAKEDSRQKADAIKWPPSGQQRPRRENIKKFFLNPTLTMKNSDHISVGFILTRPPISHKHQGND
jgi:hypothetical protein